MIANNEALQFLDDGNIKTDGIDYNDADENYMNNLFLDYVHL